MTWEGALVGSTQFVPLNRFNLKLTVTYNCSNLQLYSLVWAMPFLPKEQSCVQSVAIGFQT